MLRSYLNPFLLGIVLILSANAAQAETIEVVVFKAKNGVSEKSILNSAEGMLSTLKSWDGFISRELINAGNQKWIDVVHWRDLESAKAAQHKAMESDSCLLFFSFLEENGQQIFHGEKILTQ
jgi:heme-degrading monooxygenase HmoA